MSNYRQSINVCSNESRYMRKSRTLIALASLILGSVEALPSETPSDVTFVLRFNRKHCAQYYDENNKAIGEQSCSYGRMERLAVYISKKQEVFIDFQKEFGAVGHIGKEKVPYSYDRQIHSDGNLAETGLISSSFKENNLSVSISRKLNRTNESPAKRHNAARFNASIQSNLTIVIKGQDCSFEMFDTTHMIDQSASRKLSNVVKGDSVAVAKLCDLLSGKHLFTP